MGHIKEPKGVDLIIKSRPLTKEEETALSKYIRAFKSKHLDKRTETKPTRRTAIRKKVIR